MGRAVIGIGEWGGSGVPRSLPESARSRSRGRLGAQGGGGLLRRAGPEREGPREFADLSQSGPAQPAYARYLWKHAGRVRKRRGGAAVPAQGGAARSAIFHSPLPARRGLRGIAPLAGSRGGLQCGRG